MHIVAVNLPLILYGRFGARRGVLQSFQPYAPPHHSDHHGLFAFHKQTLAWGRSAVAAGTARLAPLALKSYGVGSNAPNKQHAITKIWHALNRRQNI